jgi:hypothetical protein
VKYPESNEQIPARNQSLKEIVKEAVREVLKENDNRDIFPFFTTQQVARDLNLSDYTIRHYVKMGEFHPRVHRTSGRTFRYLFTKADLEDFADRHFPELADLGHPNHPRSNQARAIEKLLSLKKLYKRRRPRSEES